MKPLLQTKGSKKRRELKNGGIYSITCTANDKVYIGSTIGFKHRWAEHRGQLRSGRHSNRYFQKAWQKYGEECFQFAVIEYIKYADELESTEQRWIYWFQSHDREKGFNLCPVAGSTRDRVREDWEKEKITEGLRRYHSEKIRVNPKTTLGLCLDLDRSSNKILLQEGIPDSEVFSLLEGVSINELKLLARITKVGNYSSLDRKNLVLYILSKVTIKEINECVEQWIIKPYAEKIPKPPYTLRDAINDDVPDLTRLGTRSLKKIANIFRVYQYSLKTKDELISSLMSHPRIKDIGEILSSCLSADDQIVNALPPRLTRTEIAKKIKCLETEQLQEEKALQKIQASSLHFERERELKESLLKKISQEPFKSIEECDIRTLKIIARTVKLSGYSYLTKDELISAISKREDRWIIEKALNKH